jgi:hypothetical protein
VPAEPESDRLVRAFVLFASLCLAACGARSGLGVHDAGPRADASTPRDASIPIDAWRADTGIDAPPPCVVDTDCDDGIPCTRDACGREGCMHSTDDAVCNDGLFCNGVETCSLGGCVAGAAQCADGIDCTDDRCIEASDSCAHDPDDARCPLSNTCDVIRGCEPRLLAQDPTSIYNIALPSGEVSLIARTSQALTDIALGEDGTFYGATNRNGLVRLDPRTGVTTPIVRVPGQFLGLEADPSSSALYGATDDRIVRFDLVTGSLIDVARLPAGEIVSGDIAFVGGLLVITATRNFGTANDDLFAVDLTTSGPPRLVGSTGHPAVWGLAVYRDTLYGLTRDGLVLQINPITAASTIVSRSSITFDGAAAR